MVNPLAAVGDWLTDGANWRGAEGIPQRLAEHVVMSVESVLLAVLVALPVALFLGHVQHGGILAVGLSNVGRAIPAFALLVVCAQLLGFGSAVPIVVALVALAVPPIVTNTYVGVTDVDPAVVEAARGMGLSGWQVLVRVEFPLALPLIMASVRTAAVQVVATATLAAKLAQGGLGRFIFDGQSQNDVGKMVGGALLVGLLAIGTELALALAQRAISPTRRGGMVRAGPAGTAAEASDAGRVAEPVGSGGAGA